MNQNPNRPQDSPSFQTQSSPQIQPNPQNPYADTLSRIQGNFFYGQPAPSRRPVYSLPDSVFAWASIAVGFLLIRALPVWKHPLGAVLAVCLLFGFGTAYLVISKIRPSRASILFAALAGVFSLGLLTNANVGAHRLLFFFLICAFFYYVYCASGLSGQILGGENRLLHLCYAVFGIPVCSMHHLFQALPIRNKRGVSSMMRTVGWTLLGIAVAAIPTAIVTLLLSYDEQFTGLLESIFSFSLDGVFEVVRDLIFAFLVAIILFGVLFGVKNRKESTEGKEQAFPAVNCHVLPKALLCAAVTPILGIYAIFFASQWGYYVSAFTHRLPEHLTYADYARSGFFELCWVSAINAGILLLFHLLIRRKPGEKGVLRAIYSVLFSLATLVLIATALSKMLLYIDSYGLTQKRVYASLLMLLLAACFLAVLVAQFVKKLRPLPVILVLCLIFFGLGVLPNVDGMIADYNVDAYLAGDLPDVDVETLASYGEASVPALCRLHEHMDSLDAPTDGERALLKETESALAEFAAAFEEEEASFFSFNFPRARARTLLRDLAK